jgi:hypothetical protein
MNLTRDDWLKVILLVVGALLTAGLNITVREWYQPDVRYVVGGWYRSTDLAVAGARLHNKGHADAENIFVTATFTNPLIDIATNDITIPFTSSMGGIGHKTVTGTITRLVPNEAVEIYFVTKPSSPWVDQGSFIQGIKFNGGLGKTGTPWLPWLVVNLSGFAVVGGICVWLSSWLLMTRATYYGYFSETVRMGLSAAQGGLSDEQLRMRVEHYRQTIPWFRRPSKEHLIRSAQAAFAGAAPRPLSTEP